MNQQERRRFARWDVGAQAKVTPEGSDVTYTCHISDIGVKGIQLACAIKLEKDTNVRLRIALSDASVLQTEGWVAWQRVVGTVILYGIYFSKISDADKETIFQYLKKNFPQEITRQWCASPAEKEGGQAMEDKRVFARVPVHLPVRYLEEGNSAEDLAMSCDVSAKGIGMVANRSFSPGSELEMWMDTPDGEPLYSRGKVVWVRQADFRQYRVGISLERADLMAFSKLMRA